MELTTVQLTIRNLDDQRKSASGKFLIDTGASFTVIPYEMNKRLGIKPIKTQEFSLADSTRIKRKMGFAMIEFNGEKAPSTVVIGQKGDSALLGSFTLEGMGLIVDPFKRELRPMKLMLA